MAFLNRPSPEDADLAEFARSLRATLVSAPPAGQAAAIVSRLAREARVAHAQGPSRADRAQSSGDSRLKRVGQLALGFCLVPLVAAGLAAASVKLPEPAQSAFESVGIDLPNQEEPASEVPSTSPAPAAPAGGAPGAAPGVKPGKAKPKPEQKPTKGRGKAKGKGQQGRAQAPGQSGSAGSNGNGNSNGNGGSGSPGNSGSAPGRTKAGGSTNSSGSGGAVGKTGGSPPGQANRPVSPGNSAAAPGKSK